LLGLGKVRRTRLWEFEKSEIKRRIARLLDREAEWNDERAALPIYFERKFGIDGAKPLVIETAEDEVKLCGIVDRIDQREDGWVVIDYKTARAPIAYSEALAGRNLQLPIYAMAATRVINESQPIAAAYYLHIHSRKKGTELPHKSDTQLTVDGLIAHAEARIRDYVTRIRRGEFPVHPSNAACCVNCDYKVMCRIQSLRAIAEESE
jgi:ATP-dependent helicase/DNAse subunit B